jgi:TP53 regulating kinase and related kinases
MELLAQGAEAKLFRDKEKVIKERLSKDYRLPQIDESLRKFRTRREAKVLGKLEELKFPSPHLQEFCDKRMTITMDFVPGEKLRDVFASDDAQDDFQLLAQEMGKSLGVMHNNDLIHGDFTTSNLIKDVNSNQLKVIDFGLSSFSDKVEDKAVDLFLLDRALESKHYQHYPELFEQALEGYKRANPEAAKVMERLKQVKSRGRNKKK